MCSEIKSSLISPFSATAETSRSTEMSSVRDLACSLKFAMECGRFVEAIPRLLIDF